MKLAKMILFTLTACPTGRSMGQVMNEVTKSYPAIQFDTVFVEIDVDTTNHYRIKTNPTLLFLDEANQELYRLEGFHETEAIFAVIERLRNHTISQQERLEENKATIETYTVYLIKEGQVNPVDIPFENLTSIKAPRITVINLLLKTKKEGYENPFPEDASLTSVNFENELAEVVIASSEKQEQTADMERLLLKTLSKYGITQVKLNLTEK